MTRTVHDMLGTLKAMQWQITKGHLRSLAALEGSASSCESERPHKFEIIEQRVEAFIQAFEDDGLQE